jgi:hypothetical protein
MLEHAEFLSGQMKMMANKNREYHVAIWWHILFKIGFAMQFSE